MTKAKALRIKRHDVADQVAMADFGEEEAAAPSVSRDVVGGRGGAIPKVDRQHGGQPDHWNAVRERETLSRGNADAHTGVGSGPGADDDGAGGIPSSSAVLAEWREKWESLERSDVKDSRR